MSFLKDLLNLFVNDGIRNLQEEDDLVKTLNKRIDYNSANIEDIPTKYTKVPSVGVWSNFKYLGLPSIRGIESIKIDNSIYFTIPCGWEVDPDPKFWYMCFPFDGTSSDVIEFFSTYDILKNVVRE